MNHQFESGACIKCGVLEGELLAHKSCGEKNMEAFYPRKVEKAEERQEEGPPLASLVDRFAAQFLDGLFSVALTAPFALYVFFGSGGEGSALILVVLVHLYYQLFRDGYSGRSPGKRVVGTQVVEDRSGHACGLWKSFLRNFLLHFGLGIWDAVFVFGNARKRLGDHIAGTSVIKIGQGAAYPSAVRPRSMRGLSLLLHGGLIALGCAILVSDFRGRTRSNVWIVNGLPVPVEVQLGQEAQVIAAASQEVIEDVEMGEYNLHVRSTEGVTLEEARIEVPARHDLVVWNVLRAAPLYHSKDCYGDDSGGPLPEPVMTDLWEAQLIVIEKIGYVFEDLPEQVRLYGNKRRRWISSVDVFEEGWPVTLEVLMEHGKVERAQQLAEALLTLTPEDEELAIEVVEAMAGIRDLEVFDDICAGALERFPESRRIHRTRQDLFRWYGEFDGIRAIYRAMTVENPESALFAYLYARVLPPSELLAMTRKNRECLSMDPGLRTRYAWALHQTGEFERAQVHLDKCSIEPNDWDVEFVRTAALNLVALGRAEQALDLASRFHREHRPGTHDFIALFSALHYLTGGNADHPEMRQAIWDRFEHRSERHRVWYTLASGAPVPTDLLEFVSIDDELYTAVEVAHALEKGRDGLGKYFKEEVMDALSYLDLARQVAFAESAIAAGHRELGVELLRRAPLPGYILEDAIVAGREVGYAAEIPWEVRAVIDLFDALELPAESQERRQLVERARERDFMGGWASRAAANW